MWAQSTTHASLLQRVSAGADPAAWDEFHGRYRDLIRGFAQRRGLQPADCDDVVQDVLLALTQAMRRFEYQPEKGRFRAYLKATTQRLVHRKIWHKQGGAALELVGSPEQFATPDPAAEDAWETEWRAYHVRQAMRTIEVEFNRADLRAFQWYVVEGRDAQETAAALSLTVNQVYQAKSRIVKRLAALIAAQAEDEG